MYVLEDDFPADVGERYLLRRVSEGPHLLLGWRTPPRRRHVKQLAQAVIWRLLGGSVGGTVGVFDLFCHRRVDTLIVIGDALFAGFRARDRFEDALAADFAVCRAWPGLAIT